VPEADGVLLRRIILQAVDDHSRQRGNNMESAALLADIYTRLHATHDGTLREAVLTFIHDLVTSGQIAFGTTGAGGPLNPAFCFVTARGRETLKHLSRDPHNPDGYMEYLRLQAKLDPIAQAYVEEALKTYGAHCYKATAVMIGAAAERLVFELRDVIQEPLKRLGKQINKKLEDRSAKKVFDEVFSVLSNEMERQLRMGRSADLVKLKEAFEYNWPSIVHEIRAARNDAGHPNNIDPVELENVDGTLRSFPHHARIVGQLAAWVDTATF